MNPFKRSHEGVTGTSETKNMLFFVAMLVTPFYLVAGGALLVDLMNLGAQWVIIELVAGISLWGSSTVMLYSNVKSKVAEFKCFDSAKVRFDETTIHTLDLRFHEDQMRYIGKLSSGKDVYLVGPFTETYGYDHPTDGHIIFNRAHIILPFKDTPWEQTFQFNTLGVVWEKGMPVPCPNCEAVVFNVSPYWDWIEGEWIPTFTVAYSWAHYVRSLAKMMHLAEKELKYKTIEQGKIVEKTITIGKEDDSVAANELFEAQLIEIRAENSQLRLKNARLTESRDKLLDDEKNFDKESQTRVDAYYTRHRDILSTNPPLRTRFQNLKYLAYAVAFLTFVIALLWVLG